MSTLTTSGNAATTKAAPVTHADDKFRPIQQIVEACYDKARLSHEEAQKLNAAGQKLKKAIDAFIAEERVIGRFSAEVVKAAYGYPREYKGLKPLAAQIAALVKEFGLDAALTNEFAKNVLAGRPLAKGAEGRLAFPSPVALARLFFAHIEDPAERYCAAVALVFERIAGTRALWNYWKDKMTPDRFRLSERTRQAFEMIALEQKGDIWIIDVQVGTLHGGKSPRWAVECMEANQASFEFGLEALAAGSLSLTHPERFVRFEELDMDLPGNETAPDRSGAFSESAILDFGGGLLRFGCRGVADPRVVYGAGSGFLPPQPAAA